MTPQEKFRTILNWQPPIIVPSDLPILTLEFYGANGSGGHSAIVTSPVLMDDNSVFQFVERETKLYRWIMAVGSPFLNRKNLYEWKVIR